VTEGTVKVHVNHILAKLGVAGRVEATMVALQRGIVQLMRNRQESSGTLGIDMTERVHVCTRGDRLFRN